MGAIAPIFSRGVNMSSQFSAADLRSFVTALYNQRPVQIIPYNYGVQFQALAQNSQQTSVLNITGNADFVLTAMRYRAQIGGAQTVSSKTAAFVRLMVTDAGTNESWSNNAIDIENFCANGASEAGLMSYPRFISGRSALSFVATNYAPTAETYVSLDLMLDGVLVRAYSG
jgi:hypothetical protein